MQIEAKERQWSYSTLSLFQQCQKKYYWKKIKGLVPTTEAPALKFGKAIHEALKVFYDLMNRQDVKISRDEAINNAISFFSTNYQDPEDDDKRTVFNGIKLLRGYEEVYRNEPFKITHQEIAFACPIYYKGEQGEQRSFILCGILDGIIDWNDALYVLERKTTGMMTSNFFRPFEMSGQFDGYVLAAEAFTGKKCLAVLADGMEVWKDVKKVTDKTKKLEDHYARDPISRSGFELSEFCQDMGWIVEDILRAEEKGRFPRNKNACFSYMYKCPYWDLCKYGEDESTMKRNFKVDFSSPLNNGGEDATTT